MSNKDLWGLWHSLIFLFVAIALILYYAPPGMTNEQMRAHWQSVECSTTRQREIELVKNTREIVAYIRTLPAQPTGNPGQLPQ